MIYHFWLPTRKLQGLLCTGTGPIWSKRYNKTGLKLYLDSILKSRDFTLSKKACLVIAMVFPVVMYGCESWHRRIDAFELWCWRRLESPLDCQEIQLVRPKGNQSWIFIGRTDAEAETPTLWPPDKKNWLIGKDPEAGKDWRQEEKGTTEDEMVGWHHWLDGHEFDQALGVCHGQGSLVCCSQWGHKELDAYRATELNRYMGRCKILCSLKSFLSYVCQLSRATSRYAFFHILSSPGFTIGKWLQSDGCYITGISFLPVPWMIVTDDCDTLVHW